MVKHTTIVKHNHLDGRNSSDFIFQNVTNAYLRKYEKIRPVAKRGRSIQLSPHGMDANGVL